MQTALALTAVASALAAAGAWVAPADPEPRAAAGSRLLALAALTWAVVAAAETPLHRAGSTAALALAFAAFLLLLTRPRRVGHARLALVVPGLLAVAGAEAAAIAADEPAVAAAAAAGWLLVAIAASRVPPARARTAAPRRDSTREHAYYDHLTGLANRELLERRAALALRDGQGAAAIALELDDFGAVAHLLGAAAGDELLVAAARRLAGAMREDDTVARLAAARFAVLAPGVASDRRAGELARRAAQALRAPFAIDGSELCVRTSTAVAVAEGGEPHVAHYLIREAEARFEAQPAGWDGSAGELDGALARGELELAYQPVFDLGLGGIRSVEALLRWRHPEHGELPAESFVAAMEESGVLADAGAWALREACTQWRRWLDSGAGWARLGVSVNVSASQLFDRRLMTELRAALFASGIPPARLSLELGEAPLLDDPEGAAAAVSELRALGVRVALDDFGSGSVPIASLRRFAIDAVKVDGRDTELARAAAAAAQALGLESVVKRLEQPDQLAALRTAGCTLGQGHLLARPRAAEAVAILLGSSRQAAA